MNHEERRVWLIKSLLSENIAYRKYGIPEDEQEQKNMLRSLMNVCMPDPSSGEFLKIQDEYLQKENASSGFVSIGELTPVKRDARLYLWQGDITRLKVDAIINAANEGYRKKIQYIQTEDVRKPYNKRGFRLSPAA